MDHPVHVSDWMPTLVNLLGISPANDPKWDGQDIWPLITGEVNNPDTRDIYWNFKGGQGLCIRSGDWKLISNQFAGENDRSLELFNIGEDPFEENEISASNKDKVEELSKKIDEQYSVDYLDERSDLADLVRN